MAILWVLAVLAALAAGVFGGYVWADLRSLAAEHEQVKEWRRAELQKVLTESREG